MRENRLDSPYLFLHHRDANERKWSGFAVFVTRARKRAGNVIGSVRIYIRLITRVSVEYDEVFHECDSIVTSRRRVEIQSTSEMSPYFTMTKCNKLFITYLTRSTER